MITFEWHRVKEAKIETYHCRFEDVLLVVSSEDGNIWHWGAFSNLEDGGCRLVPLGLCRLTKQEAMGAAGAFYAYWGSLQ